MAKPLKLPARPTTRSSSKSLKLPARPTSGLETLLRTHHALVKAEAKLTTLKNVLTGKLPQTEKAATALRRESILCEKNLAARLKLLERITAKSKGKLPGAFYDEWQRLASKNHTLGNPSRIAAAQGKASNGAVRSALEEHAGRMRAFYTHAEARLTASGLTFAKVEAREE